MDVFSLELTTKIRLKVLLAKHYYLFYWLATEPLYFNSIEVVAFLPLVEISTVYVPFGR